MRAAPVTIVELQALREIVGNFSEPAKTFGLSVSPDDSTVRGPCHMANTDCHIPLILPSGVGGA
jgi:hypothetical protein